MKAIYNPSGGFMAKEASAEDRIRMSVDRWLRAAVADADRRGLPELRPLLEGLAQATITLRAADWNDTMPEATERGAP
jgi:hypothetical protein